MQNNWNKLERFRFAQKSPGNAGGRSYWRIEYNEMTILWRVAFNLGCKKIIILVFTSIEWSR